MRCLIPCLPAQVASAPVDYIYAIGEMMPGGKPAPGIGSHAGEAGPGVELWQGLPPPSFACLCVEGRECGANTGWTLTTSTGHLCFSLCCQ